MAAATHNQIVQLFPGIQDHSVVEILATKATVEELEAAMLLLNDEDEGMIDLKKREGDQLNRLLDVLSNSEIMLQEDRDQ
jgi:hypothetical protein